MTNQQYIHKPLAQLKLDKNRKRVKLCPCGKDNTDGKFVPFIGYNDKGYCHSCGNTFLPELIKNEQWDTPFPKPQPKPQIKIDFIPFEMYQIQLKNGINLYGQNHFIQWLGNNKRGEFAFDAKTIQSLIESYFLGNSGKEKYKGWVLFPYIDIHGRIRDIKAIDYNPLTGKRIREPFNKCHYVGKEILNNQSANTVRCFYGEHLLKGNNNPVKIFESEATATYAAAFYPKSVCLATGGKNGCKWNNKEVFKVLDGHQIILYPDIDAHEEWEKQAEILSEKGLNITVSKLIKESAIKYAEQSGVDYSELVKAKYDLRDILKNMDLQKFLNSSPPPEHNMKKQPLIINQISEVNNVEQYIPIDNSNNEKKETVNYENEIQELEDFFHGLDIPSTPIKLDQCTTIIDAQKFIEHNFACLKRNDGKPIFLPDLKRLQSLMKYLKTHIN